MTSAAEQAAALALETFHNLPRKHKPRDLPDGAREWTPLSAIILSKVEQHPKQEAAAIAAAIAVKPRSEHSFKVVSLATGTKSLPVSALPRCEGRVLHDCHAEILALRGLNYWLLGEMECILQNPGYESAWLKLNDSLEDEADGLSSRYPIALRADVRISLFSTTAPCGDASMDLLVRASSDAHPWPEENIVPGSLPLGRGHFSLLGRLRRKPARADAEVSMSKSCTDKLMLSQFLGVLRFPLYMFMDGRGCRLTRLIVYDEEFDEVGYRRAFSREGRLHDLASQQEKLGEEATAAAQFFDFDVLPKDFSRFEYAKPSNTLDRKSRGQPKVCNFSTLWVASSGSPVSSAGENGDGGVVVLEQIINSVKQGFKQWDPRAAKSSCVSREKMARKAIELAKLLRQQQRDIPRLPDLFPAGLRCGSTLR